MYGCTSCKAKGTADEMDRHCLASYETSHATRPHYSYKAVN
ncbi:hypothetical protein CF_19 [Curtobacterium phage Ayka]|nr:hypothetical protein CF_19 [Curtobacterium phage Ayka]